MKMKYSPEARDELLEIAQYIRKRSKVGAKNVKIDIVKSIQSLATSPKLGKPQAGRPVRKLITPQFHYIIYYLSNEAADEITVLNIFDPAQDRSAIDE